MASTGTCTTALNSLYVGIDFGTSGCRSIAINDENIIVAETRAILPESQFENGHITQTPQDWWLACQQVLSNLLAKVQRLHVKAIAINGTSGTVLLCDSSGTPLSNAYMYNDNHNAVSAKRIGNTAPRNSGAHGASSGLAKCLSLLEKHKPSREVKCLNQADWISGNFTHQYNVSDQNNSLKLGFDVIHQQWPTWLDELGCRKHLPDNIFLPGKMISTITPQVAHFFGLSQKTQLIAGTTDSIAAFIATNSQKTGEAVTSLGSTLAIKLIADKPIFAPEYGVYSHRLGKQWLVGGASNTGGAVIKKHFSSEKIAELTPLLQPQNSTGLDYYPLLKPGERFPISDNNHPPKLTPRPDSELEFFQGILEGISQIEKTAYDKLAMLGAGYPTQIKTMGGGSINDNWQKIRQKILGVPVSKATITEAAYGAALLAKQGFQS